MLWEQPVPPDHDRTDVEYSPLDGPQPEKRPRGGPLDRGWWTGFRATVGIGVAVTAAVMLLNIVVLAWASTHPTSGLGTRVLFEGDCGTSSAASTVAHLFVNVLSTLLLAASNAAMQCLCAPTRSNVDAAHARGSWLDIGVGSVRNFVFIGVHRKAAWVALLLTSLPLHLLYNSVVIQSTSANEYYAVVVTQDFLDGAPIDTSLIYGVSVTHNATDVTQLEQIQSEAPTYSDLPADQCLDYYGNPFVEGRANVVVSTNVSSHLSNDANSSVLFSCFFSPSAQEMSYNLFYETDPDLQGGRDQDGLRPYLRDGTMPYIVSQQTPDASADSDTSDAFANYDTAMVTGCRSQEVEAVCTVEMHSIFLVVVIVANALKLGCFAWLLYNYSNHSPLVTTGDAVASFMGQPDAVTEGGCAISLDDVERHQYSTPQNVKKHGAAYFQKVVQTWTNRRIRWLRAVTSVRRFCLIMVCIIYCAVAIGLPVSMRNGVDDSSTSLQDLWDNGFGHVYPQNVLNASLGWSISGNIIFANLPQLALSVLYLSYNQFWTTMCAAHEAMQMAATRDYLRVSVPRGQQRSTFWLSLPLWFAVPLMAASAALHWALSQSVFLAEIVVATPGGDVDEGARINAVGYSLLGALITAIIGGVMLLALLGVGTLRRFPAGMPLMSTCSSAIAAACHGNGFRQGEAEQALMYGVVEVTGEKMGRVGFSGEEVEPLQDGWLYNGKGQQAAEDDAGMGQHETERTSSDENPQTESIEV